MTKTEWRVTFWGTRGSIATPGLATARYGGNTACIQLDCGTQTFILDAGTGLRGLGQKLAGQAPQERHYHIFLSHTHWDHIQGLPFFAPAYQPGNTLHIYGSARKDRMLARILNGQMNREYFPVQMQDLPAQIEIHEWEPGRHEVAGIRIDCEEQSGHPGGSLRFRFHKADTHFVYATDVEIANHAEETTVGTDPAYLAFIQGADLLVADAQYTAEEYAPRRGWGHSAIPAVLAAAREARVGQLALFHHDPDHDDSFLEALERTLETSGPRPTRMGCAREGQTIHLA